MGYLHLGLAALLFLAGCSTREHVPAAEVETHYVLHDLDHYPQDAAAYAENIIPHAKLLEAQKHFERSWFAPWSYTEPPETLEAIEWPFRTYAKGDSYGENLQRLPESWFVTMYERSNFGSYGTVNRYAVTLRFSHLRCFPTHKPLFRDPEKAGEGFPFDYLQNSGVHANEPLFVSHYSKEGDWVYVFTSYANGWLPSHAIAYIPEAHTRKWRAAKQFYLVRDRVPVKDREGNFLFNGRIGMMMPAMADNGGDEVSVLAVTADVDGKAWYTEGRIARDAISEAPLELDRQTLPALANRILRSRYGWGGLYEERDCSSTLRDLFTPFGIWLPRNSSQQSRRGRVISFEGLSEREKVETIISQGVPFETLLYRKGHILLYVGVYEGEVMVLHNLWGVKTTNGIDSDRKIVGKAVISTLAIGSELTTYDPEGALLRNIESMNIITQQ
jgi:hypothetical protein